MQSLIGFIASLLVDTSFSWGRMLIALFLSIVISLFVGIYAATNKTAERIIIPIWDIFQTLPILAFFPFVIFIIVAVIPGYVGINAAVIFLIVTSMIWNITFGVYESIKTIPEELIEMGKIFNLSNSERLRKILIPASMPRVVEQSILSWSIGLFYLVTSEIFSTGNSSYTVKYGIGVALTNLAFSGNLVEYFIGIAIFIIFVVITRLVLFDYLKNKFTRHTVQERYNGDETKGIKIAKRLNRINPFSRLNLGVVQKNIQSIGSSISKPIRTIRKPQKKSVKPRQIDLSKYKKVAYIVIALAVLCCLYLYRGYLGLLANYEYTIIISLLATLLRIWLAFAVIIAISLPVGVYLVFITRKSSAYLLLFQIIASIPATILLPLIVISLKSAPYHNELVAFVVFFLSGIWYMIFSIVSNRNAISPTVKEVKSIFGVKGKEAWKEIYIKAIIPGIITGAVTGIAAEWNASIVAERFTTSAIGNGNVVTSVNLGLGKLLDVSLSNGNLALMVLGLINLTIVIILVNRFVWKRLYSKALAPYK